MANLRANRITSTEVFETTGSVQFDGITNYLKVTNNADLRLGQTAGENFTIEGWFYNISTTSYPKTLISLWDYAHDNRSFIVELTNNSTNDLKFSYSTDGTSGAVVSLQTSDGISTGEWHHFSVTKDNEIRIYVDGILRASTTISNSTTFYAETSDEIRIGAQWGGGLSGMVGHISNLRILKGTALYTANFTPPTRELEVIPNTVLLACQHKTDATHEKTGKTITVNGNAVANELTPGLLTNVVKSGGSSAITGSVEFDGTGDYLSLADTTDFDIGLNNEPFTWEVWFNMTSPTTVTNNLGLNRGGGTAGWNSTDGHQYQAFHYTDNKLYWQFWNGSSNVSVTSNANEVSVGSWNHFAVTYDGTTTRGFLNGIQFPTTSTSNYAKPSSSNISRIGTEASGSNFGSKFQSNIRIIKGTALYTSDFIPPTRNLTKLPGTVLLCCQDNASVTTESTGKTITSNGDPAASNFTPSVGSDGSVEFAGPTTINTENYFYLPTGPTEQRGRGRGVFGGGSPSYTNTIDYIEIQTLGNATDFGDLTLGRNEVRSCSSTTRGVWAGGRYTGTPAPTSTDVIDYITIASTSNALDFGDLFTANRAAVAALSNSTRGIFAAGFQPATGGNTNVIDFITIASKGDAQDFGDTLGGYQAQGSLSSPTRGIVAGNYTENNLIEFLTISTTGNTQDFGDLTQARFSFGGASSSTRGVFGGGGFTSPTPTLVNTMDYITIASTGNAQDFGDLITATVNITSATSNGSRGVWGGGSTPTNLNTINYITITSTGNAQDFGDLIEARSQFGACSDSHGGLG